MRQVQPNTAVLLYDEAATLHVEHALKYECQASNLNPFHVIQWTSTHLKLIFQAVQCHTQHMRIFSMRYRIIQPFSKNNSCPQYEPATY